MPLRRILFGAIAVIVILALGGFAWTWRPAIAPISASERPSVDEQTYRRGAELAAIGDCNVCHVGDSGKAYAGGRAIPTPFGTIFATNITPDMETGIGGWSEAAFQRAMHEGVDRQGRQLYPAFPYDHFTKTTNDDIHALYAFLMSQPAVRNAIPANELAFPLNFRPTIAGWKILFFRDAPLQRTTAKVRSGIAAGISSKASGTAGPVTRRETSWVRKSRAAPMQAASLKAGTHRP